MNSVTNLLTPIAILVAGGAVAGAIMLTNNPMPATTPPTADAPQPHGAPERANGPQVALKAELDEDEFIYGNPEAAVFIIEYSDIDCPFCARVHPTLEAVVDASDGAIAWVFRHFPLEQLHPQAPFKAAAAECVGKLAGNDAFWQYVDGLFKQAPVTSFGEYGISQNDFEACLDDESTAAAVQADYDRAVASGGRGTPHSVVATSEIGVVVSGAQPGNVWTQTAAAITEL